MATIRHSIKRNETYHFNYRLEDKIIRKSLKTDSPSLARAYISDIIIFIRKSRYLGKQVSKSDINNFIEMLISNKVNEVVRIAKAITQPLSPTANSYFHKWFNETNIARSDIRNDQTHYIPPDTNIKLTEPTVVSYKDWLCNQIELISKTDKLYSALLTYNTEEDTCEIDQDHEFFDDFAFPTIHAEKYSYLDETVSNHAKQISKAFKQDNSIRVNLEVKELYQKFEKLLPKQSPPTINNALLTKEDESTNSPSIMFEEIKDDVLTFFRDNKQRSMKYIEDRNAPFQDFISAFKGIALNKITTSDIEEHWSKICRMPKLEAKLAEKYNFSVDTNNKSNEEVKQEQRAKRWAYIYETDEEELPPIHTKELYSEGQLKIARKLLQDIFTVAKRKKYIDVNPFDVDNIKLIIPRDRSNTRTKLPADKAKNIVDYCFNNLSHPYSWAILIMAFHGMRNEEVTSLHSSQIITDPDTSIVYIQVQKGKTKNAKRKIPVHTTLIQNGFLEFVDTKIDRNLFDFDSHQLTKHFNFFRQEFDIPLRDPDGSLINLYSFRHNVISALGEVSEEYKYRLFGHGRNTVTSGYTALDLTNSLRLINRISY
ncbi:hypothetical protein J3455_11865 [Pseudoalteromonas sp. NFXS39]|uniref:hypothetical protein n=1 Tax=Pseudoalteromonas sp. NFXS39 TaxID=2818437 RepID=UPI0032E0099F